VYLATDRSGFAVASAHTRAKTVGLLHGLGNAVVLAVETACMGGELVERLGVGVDEGAGSTRRAH
jgi:hypothetical protein